LIKNNIEDDDQNLFNASSSFNFNTPHSYRKATEQEHASRCTSHELVGTKTHPQSQPKTNNQHETNVKEEEGTNFPRVWPSFD
jgi:hypothetical protein